MNWFLNSIKLVSIKVNWNQNFTDTNSKKNIGRTDLSDHNTLQTYWLQLKCDVTVCMLIFNPIRVNNFA